MIEPNKPDHQPKFGVCGQVAEPVVTEKLQRGSKGTLELKPPLPKRDGPDLIEDQMHEKSRGDGDALIKPCSVVLAMH